MKIILGSSSPRRKIILKNLIDKFEILTPQTDETASPGESPRDFSERVSIEKGKSIIPLIQTDKPALIISCDTIVNIGKKIIGKPKDLSDAVNIIKMLSGRTHEVISSLTLIQVNNGNDRSLTDTEISHVTFKNLDQNKITNYLDKFDFKDKAGAYAVQEHGDMVIDRIDGSITNVIGFPLRLFFRMLNKLDLAGKVLELSKI